MIGRQHVPYYRELFELPGFLQDPVLTFGFHEFPDKTWPLGLRLRRLARIAFRAGLKGKGLGAVKFPGNAALPPKFDAPDLHAILRN